ncbi:MAG: PAS domain S-box protein [Salinivenus sp.]
MPQSPASNGGSPGALFSIGGDRDTLVEAIEDSDYPGRLEALVADDDRSQSERLRALLRVGAERFGVETGLLSRVDPAAGTHTITEVHGPSHAGAPGETADLSTTYARTVLAQNAVLGVTNAPEQGWAGDPAYDRFGAATYFGAKVVVNGTLYGTVAFADPAPRSDPFGEADAAALGVLVDAVQRVLGPASRPNPTRQQLEALFDGSPSMINLHDLEGNLIAPNTRLCEKTGYTADELTQMKVWDLDQEATPERVRVNWTNMEPGDRNRWEGRYRRKDGSTFPVEVDLRRLDVSGAARFAVVSRDITDRKEAEAAVVDRQEKIQALYETTSRLPRSRRPDVVAGHLHDLLQEIFDYSVTAVNLRRGDVLVPEQVSVEGPDGIPNIQPLPIEGESIGARAYRTGETVVVEDLRALDNDLDYGALRGAAAVPIGEHGAVVVGRVEDGRLDSFLLRLVDILAAHAATVLDRIEREDALRAERNLLDRILETSPAAITVLDPDGNFIEASGRAQDVLGLEKDAVTDRAFNDPEWRLRRPDGQPMPEEELPFRRVMATGAPVWDVEHTVEWPDGTRRLLSVSGAPLHDADGALEGAVFHLDDITERRRAQENLRARETQLRGLTNSVPGVVYQFVAAPDGTYGSDFVSEQVESMLGIEAHPDTFFDQFVQRIPDGHREPFVASVEAAVEREAPWRQETPFEKPSGERIWLLGVSTPVRREGELVYNGVLLDITERKAAEQALRDERDRFATLFHNLPTPVVRGRTDDEGRLRIRAVNEAFETTFGYDEDTIRGEDIQALIVPEEERPAADSIRRRVLVGEPTTQEVQRTAADGRRDFRIQVAIREGDAGPVESFAIYTDITERKERERALAQRTALLEAQAEATIDGLLAVDDDRRVVFHNEQLLDLWGLPAPPEDGVSDVLPRHRPLDALSDRVHRPEAFRSMVDALYDHPGADGRDLIRRTAGRWLDQYSAPIVGEDGTHFGRLWAFRDVTERRRMQERLLEVQEEERRRIDQEIHDEMGGLLTSLQFTVGLARRQAGDDAVHDALDQIETLVSDLSTMARTISRKLYPSALSDYGLAGALPSLADDMAEKHDLVVDLRVETEAEARFPSLVERTAYWVVQEALLNAARHAETDAARVAVTADEDHLALEIADEGVGFGADAPGDDSSFGLEGIRRRVERLDGAVEIASTPGEGTRIAVHLPLRTPLLDDA